MSKNKGTDWGLTLNLKFDQAGKPKEATLHSDPHDTPEQLRAVVEQLQLGQETAKEVSPAKRRRTNDRTTAIKAAQRLAEFPDDERSILATLIKMALSGKSPHPLVGFADDELKWESQNGDIECQSEKLALAAIRRHLGK